MKTNLTNGPSVKSLVSQYEQKISAYQDPKEPVTKRRGEQPELRSGSTEHLKKQQAPNGAVLQGYLNQDLEMPREQQVNNYKTGDLSGERQQQVNNYKGGYLPEFREEQVSQYLTRGENGQLEDRSQVKVFTLGEMPEEWKHNHGPVTYLKGAESLDPQQDWKTKGGPVPSYLKGYAFQTPGAAIEGLRVEKPGSFAFYQPETKATQNEGQLQSWDRAMRESGGNEELAAKLMYQADSTRLGVAVKSESGEVSRYELPMKFAHECPTQKALVYQINQATGLELDAAKMADASYMFRS